MPNNPPTNEYYRVREAELQLELANDKLVTCMANARRARMNARDAGEPERAETFDQEFKALHAEQDALWRGAQDRYLPGSPFIGQ